MRVLFVDDDTKVLRGIERMLESADVDWDLEFAESGHRALELLNEDKYDAIISDMKMPTMDGAALLQEVSEAHPEVIRVVLSGQADKQAVFNAVHPMHQYLAKPCDATAIINTLNRANELRTLLNSHELRKLITQLHHLPSVPSVYSDLMEMMSQEDYSVQDIAHIVSQDPAMTAKLLQLANSAAFGVQRTISTPIQAVSYLGADNIRALALSIGVFHEFQEEKLGKFSIEQLFNHSVQVATAASRIAIYEETPKEVINEIYTAGILHDIGKLVLATAETEKYDEAVSAAQCNGQKLTEVENEIFGTDHAAVGAYLLSLWGIPESITEIVGLHHQPWRFAPNEFSPFVTLSVANELCTTNGDPSPELKDYLEQIGCSDKLVGWQELILDEEVCDV